MTPMLQDLAPDIVELAPYVPPAGALREMGYHVRAWTPAETDRLREMFAADEAIAAIAEALDRPFQGVRARIGVLGSMPRMPNCFADMGRKPRRRLLATSGGA